MSLEILEQKLNAGKLKYIATFNGDCLNKSIPEIETLQIRIENLQNEILTIENSKEDNKIKIENSKKELKELLIKAEIENKPEPKISQLRKNISDMENISEMDFEIVIESKQAAILHCSKEVEKLQKEISGKNIKSIIENIGNISVDVKEQARVLQENLVLIGNLSHSFLKTMIYDDITIESNYRNYIHQRLKIPNIIELIETTLHIKMELIELARNLFPNLFEINGADDQPGQEII